MNIDNFIGELQEELEFEDTTLTLETKFKECDEWDSMTALTLMAYAEENFSVNLNAEDLIELVTIEDLAKKFGVI